MSNIYQLMFSIILILILKISSSSYYDKDWSILEEQLKNHPIQTLQDVYKSCYQDEYGPGHMIANESSSMNYLIEEINSMEKDYNPPTIFEKTGLEGNFIRVDLILVKNETIPLFVLFKALLISATIGSQKSDDGWADIWSDIVDALRNSTLKDKFDNFEEDAKRLEIISKSDDKVVHHSDIYENTYHPHYRIIEKDVFENYIKPFIN